MSSDRSADRNVLAIQAKGYELIHVVRRSISDWKLSLFPHNNSIPGDFDHFEAFMSLRGPAFYRLPPNAGSIHLRREAWVVPEALPYIDSSLIPFMAGETLNWKLDTNV